MRLECLVRRTSIAQRRVGTTLRGKWTLEKVLGEHKTLAALQKGEKLADVFKRYGVL